MKKNLLEKSRHIHFIGIGGIGVSALAAILLKQGKKISGSDHEMSKIIENFINEGADICLGHAANNVKTDTELVIYSLAIPKTNPELKAAAARKIPVLSYPEAVGELTKKFFTIAVCGTHGKSTITAMLAKALTENNLDPTVIVGTKLKEFGEQNYRAGKSRILVLEACEYKRAFLNYSPHAILLHTLDPDHLDYYRDFNDYMRAFDEFVLRLPRDGYFFANLDDEDVHTILQSMQRNKFPLHNTITYGKNYSSGDFYLKGDNIFQRNTKVGKLDLKIPGAHNRTNALAAFAVCAVLGIAPRDILKSINHYAGAFRRFETKGTFGRATVIDDYAHHPTEIQATLQALREKFPKEKVCAVFQPHQYSRTKSLLGDFGASFRLADAVIIPNIYEARDSKKDKKSVTPERLVSEIQKQHKNVRYGGGLENTLSLLRKQDEKFDVIITMGAGDVWQIADALTAD